jgi:co-chaperonin GroES (HSP10)
MAKKEKPTHEAFVAVKTGNKDDDGNDKTVWLKVGSGWAHDDGKGMNLVLQALPVDGKLVVRRPLPPRESDDA